MILKCPRGGVNGLNRDAKKNADPGSLQRIGNQNYCDNPTLILKQPVLEEYEKSKECCQDTPAPI